MGVSADRQQRIDELRMHEGRLQNGGRGSVEALSDAVVSMSHALRVLLNTDFVTHEACARKHRATPWVVFAAITPVVIGAVTIAGMILLK